MSVLCSPKLRHSWLCLFALLASAGIASGQQQMRTWTDSTGKFKIQAKFSALTDGNVTLTQADGTEVELPLSKLSVSDQKFVRSIPADNPFQQKEANPFASKSGTTGGRPSMPSTSPATGGSRDNGGTAMSEATLYSTPDMPNPILLVNQSQGWKVDVADLVKSVPESIGGKPISLPPKFNVFEKVGGLVLNGAGTHAVATLNANFPNDINQTRLVLIDVKAAKSRKPISLNGQWTALALADDGETVVVKAKNPGRGKPEVKEDQLEVWRFLPSGISKEFAWVPYVDYKDGGREVKQAWFDATGNLLTINPEGQLCSWVLEPLAANWTCKLSRNAGVTLSPDRRSLLIAESELVCLLDLAKEQVTSSMALKSAGGIAVSLSPEATRFAVATPFGHQVFDTATGELYREVDTSLVPGSSGQTPVLFVNEEQALFNKQTLLDLPSLVPIWAYSGADAVEGLGTHVWFCKLGDEKSPGVIFGAPLPHPAATAALQQAINDPDYFILKPGASVKLNLDQLPDQTEREKIRESMTKKFESKKITVSDSAPIEVVCRFDSPTSEKIQFHGFGGFQVVDFQQTVGHIQIKMGDQDLWKTQVSNRPNVVNYSRNETLQQAVRKHEVPPYRFFRGANLPSMLVNPSKGKGTSIGSSNVTTRGII